jgi:hypothetical protein
MRVLHMSFGRVVSATGIGRVPMTAECRLLTANSNCTSYSYSLAAGVGQRGLRVGGTAALTLQTWEKTMDSNGPATTETVRGPESRNPDATPATHPPSNITTRARTSQYLIVRHPEMLHVPPYHICSRAPNYGFFRAWIKRPGVDQ